MSARHLCNNSSSVASEQVQGGELKRFEFLSFHFQLCMYWSMLNIIGHLWLSTFQNISMNFSWQTWERAQGNDLIKRSENISYRCIQYWQYIVLSKSSPPRLVVPLKLILGASTLPTALGAKTPLAPCTPFAALAVQWNNDKHRKTRRSCGKKLTDHRVMFAQKSRDGYQEIGTSHLRIDWNNSGWKWRVPEFLDNMTAMAIKELTWFVGDTMRVKNHIYAKVPWTCPAGTRKQMAENQTWKKA